MEENYGSRGLEATGDTGWSSERHGVRLSKRGSFRALADRDATNWPRNHFPFKENSEFTSPARTLFGIR